MSGKLRPYQEAWFGTARVLRRDPVRAGAVLPVGVGFCVDPLLNYDDMSSYGQVEKRDQAPIQRSRQTLTGVTAGCMAWLGLG